MRKVIMFLLMCGMVLAAICKFFPQFAHKLVFNTLSPRSTDSSFTQPMQGSRRIDADTSSVSARNTSGTAGGRVALLIGNAAYKNVPPLSNPLNDVRAFAQALREVGFEVLLRENCDLRTMDECIQDFWNRLKGKEAGLFYYSGHGMQVNGENYLVPVSAKIEQEMDIKYNCYQAQKVLDYMDDAKAKTNILILDACRNNPFKRSVRSAAMGLAPMDAIGQMFIAYATDPDKVANDGEPGGNSPYMRHILKNIKRPGMPVEMLFKEVRAGVLEETGYKQRPWELSCLTRNFCFVPSEMAPAQKPDFSAEPPLAQNPVAIPQEPSKPAKEEQKSAWSGFWNSWGQGNSNSADSNGSGTSLRERAENGDGQAQYELGLQYFEGRTVPKDMIEAVSWFKKSAENGVASGQIKLAWMYENGKGVAQDKSEAKRWYSKAAEQGNPFAQKALKNLDAKKSRVAAAKKPRPVKNTTMVSNTPAPAPVPAPAAQKPAPEIKTVSTPTAPPTASTANSGKSSQKADWKQVQKALEQKVIESLIDKINKK